VPTIRRGLQENGNGAHPAGGGLFIHVELAEGLDLVVEKLDPGRNRVLPGKDVENPAAQRELTPLEYLGHAFVIRPLQPGEQGREIDSLAKDQVDLVVAHRSGRWNDVSKAFFAKDDDLALGNLLTAAHGAQDSESIRRDVGIWQGINEPGEFDLWKEEGGDPQTRKSCWISS